MSITPDSRITVRSSTSRWRSVGESIVIMDLEHSTYFAIEGSVAHVWDRLVVGATISELAADLAAEFDVDQETVEVDLIELCGDLERRGVVTSSSMK